jgi:hypothetical protein
LVLDKLIFKVLVGANSPISLIFLGITTEQCPSFKLANEPKFKFFMLYYLTLGTLILGLSNGESPLKLTPLEANDAFDGGLPKPRDLNPGL